MSRTLCLASLLCAQGAADDSCKNEPGDLQVPTPSTNIEFWTTDASFNQGTSSEYPRQDGDFSQVRKPSYVWDDCETAKGPVYDQNTFMTWFPHAIKCTWDQAQAIDKYTSIKEWWSGEGISDHYDGQDISTALSGYTGYSEAGYSWTKATLSQVYSLIEFSGACGSPDRSDLSRVPSDSRKFIDNTSFEIPYGDTHTSTTDPPRWIDGQIWGDDNVQNSMQMYDSTGQLRRQDDSAFGVNFLDGRIKAYPKIQPKTQKVAVKAVMFVENNEASQRYITKISLKVDGDTATDSRTGLMWEVDDSQQPMSWQDALKRCAALSTGGYSDWRLPSVKELQTLVDYNTAVITATDRSRITDIKVFADGLRGTKVLVNGNLPGDSEDETYYGYYWSATTHFDTDPGHPDRAAYIPFGPALGFFSPPGAPQGQLTDVHGAGAQRSDSKSSSDVPGGASWNSDGSYYYMGPQGDVLRPGNNLARCTRTAVTAVIV